MVIGSSGLPAPVISCMSALPMEVTRSETCVSLPSMSACCGTDVTWPSHEPARVFNLSKDFCASDCGRDFCALDCAKAMAESGIRTTDTIKRRDFMFLFSCVFGAEPSGVIWFTPLILLLLTLYPLHPLS